MRKALIPVLPVIGFLVTLGGHAAYHVRSPTACQTACAAECQSPESAKGLRRYIGEQDYMLGTSYGLAVAFTVYAAFRWVCLRRSTDTKALVGGAALTALLYGVACFLLGCCGSPLLPVYLSLFGAQALGFGKPLILFLTTCSVAFGLLWLRRRTRVCTC